MELEYKVEVIYIDIKLQSSVKSIVIPSVKETGLRVPEHMSMLIIFTCHLGFKPPNTLTQTLAPECPNANCKSLKLMLRFVVALVLSFFVSFKILFLYLY